MLIVAAIVLAVAAYELIFDFPGASVSARDLLAAATPRPWQRKESAVGGRGYGLLPAGCVKDGDGFMDGDGEGWIAISSARATKAADAALIVAAVNEYEALLDLEAVARDWYESHLSTCACQACVVLRRLGAVRSGT